MSIWDSQNVKERCTITKNPQKFQSHSDFGLVST